MLCGRNKVNQELMELEGEIWDVRGKTEKKRGEEIRDRTEQGGISTKGKTQISSDSS